MERNWTTSKSSCEALGGKLIEPHSVSFNNDVANIALDVYGSVFAWIGINDPLSNDQWSYASNGTLATYINWRPGQPNDSNQGCSLLWCF